MSLEDMCDQKMSFRNHFFDAHQKTMDGQPRFPTHDFRNPLKKQVLVGVIPFFTPGCLSVDGAFFFA
jgi:hypothetical protein